MALWVHVLAFIWAKEVLGQICPSQSLNRLILVAKKLILARTITKITFSIIIGTQHKRFIYDTQHKNMLSAAFHLYSC
jgi:hypothetical protein